MSRALRVLDAAALAVNEALTLEEISTALEKAFTDLGWDYALLLKEDGVQHLGSEGVQTSGTARTGTSDPSAQAALLRRVEDAIQRQDVVLVEGQPVLVADLEPLHKTGSIDLPLLAQEQVIGLLSLHAPAWAEGDLPVVARFARRLALTLQKAQALEELQQRLARLEQSQAQSLQAQKLEAIARLAGGVAHDFNNALTVIRLSVQLIKLRLPADDRLLEYVRQIEEAGERAAGLTEQLLSFSQRDDVDARPVDLNQLIRGLLPMVQHILGEQITLVTSLQDGLWPVRLDPTRWDQVIFQVATHARDAMPDGGTLRVDTANVEVAPSEAASHPDVEAGSYVLLSVSDTGPGLDPDVQARLFEPFFSTSERARGSGLGLAMAYGIVRQNGGQIRVSSEPDEGTTFRIYLPRIQAEQA
ncbi:MAG: ATP-binding protein [Anaerolineae bacterium]|nr:ATP-binding protein [Anaerolineae bacterium]